MANLMLNAFYVICILYSCLCVYMRESVSSNWVKSFALGRHCHRDNWILYMYIHIFWYLSRTVLHNKYAQLQIRKLNLRQMPSPGPEKWRKYEQSVQRRTRATFVNFIYGHVAFQFCFRFFLMATNKLHKLPRRPAAAAAPPPSGVKGHLSAEKCWEPAARTHLAGPAGVITRHFELSKVLKVSRLMHKQIESRVYHRLPWNHFYFLTKYTKKCSKSV